MELWKVSQEIYERVIKAMYMKYGEKQDWRDVYMVWYGMVRCGVHCVCCAVCVVVCEIWCFLFWVLCFVVLISCFFLFCFLFVLFFLFIFLFDFFWFVWSCVLLLPDRVIFGTLDHCLLFVSVISWQNNTNQTKKMNKKNKTRKKQNKKKTRN